MGDRKMIRTDKVIYRTRTQEEYDWLMEKLEKAGCRWTDGYFPTALKEDSNWREYFSETCIRTDVGRLSFADFDFYFYKDKSEYEDYEFIEVSDLMEEETDAQDKTEEETNTLEELEAIHKQVTNQIGELRKQGKEPKTVEYTIKVCFE